MNPTLAALIGGGVAAGYIPILRNQIRDGYVGIPLGSVNPIRIRRDDNPPLFRLAAGGMCAAVALLISACVIIVIHGLAA